MDFDGMFPPTGAEMAAHMEAQKNQAKAEEVEGEKSKAAKHKKKDSRPDLRPPGMSPVVKKVLNGIAILAVLGVAYYGYLFIDRVQSATLVTELESGQCISDFFSEVEGEFRNVFVVDTTDCDKAHAYEVFTTSNSVFSDVTSEGYPGVERTFAIGQDFCRAQYDEFVGGEFASSPWQVWTFVPTEPRWGRGDRKVQCLVGDANETVLVEGTLEGAGN